MITKEELDQITDALIEELREMPDGTRTATAWLMAENGYDTADYNWEDLYEIHDELLRKAKKNHIILDMSEHENREEGPSYVLDYVVENQKAKIKCPRCGSRDTARILYGMPLMDEVLQEKLNSGSIVLGGCFLKTVRMNDGFTADASPKRFCNHCKKTFGTPPILTSKNESEDYLKAVTGIRFSVMPSRGPWVKSVSIKKNADGAAVHVRDDRLVSKRKMLETDYQISPPRWSKLVNKLFTELYIHEWKKNYTNPLFLDGIEWTLEILMTDRRRRVYKGSNAYPPYCKELNTLLNRYFRG